MAISFDDDNGVLDSGHISGNHLCMYSSSVYIIVRGVLNGTRS
jgi:hypothetical protein